MGYALAEAAVRRGAHVILVSGPTDLKIPEGVDWVPVNTAEEMRGAVRDRAAEANIVVMAAAVADYRPAAAHARKSSAATIASRSISNPRPIFSPNSAAKKARASSSDLPRKPTLAENARAKLARKGADMIVANDVTQEGAGFDADTNIVTLFLRDGRDIPLPKMSKFEVANRILDQALQIEKP